MIKCPECGQDISEKAKKCIHCGKVFVEEQLVNKEIRCLECGAILSETDEICQNCGCPVEKLSQNQETQQVEVASIKISKSSKKWIIGIIIAFFICIMGGVGYKIYNDYKARQEYQETYNTYIDELQNAQVLMLAGGAASESLCNLTLQVWGNCIFKKTDNETDKYTKKYDGFGDFYDDFNTAILTFYADSDTQVKILNIKENQSLVMKRMKKLQNTPEGLDKCYDTITDLYKSYKILTDLAIKPTGNYNGYSDNKDSAVSDFTSDYDKLDSQMPDKIEDK